MLRLPLPPVVRRGGGGGGARLLASPVVALRVIAGAAFSMPRTSDPELEL